MTYTDSNACASRQHCTDCRASREFRRSIAEHWEVPGGVIDFACPIGLPIIGDVSDEPAPSPPPPRPSPQPRPASSSDPFTAEVAHERRVEASRPILSQPGPGDLLKHMVENMGIDPQTLKGCGGCEARRAQMNQFWYELYGDAPMDDATLRAYLKKNWLTITAWLTAQAVRHAILPTPGRIRRAVAAGKEWWAEQQPPEMVTCRYLLPWAGPCRKPAGTGGFCSHHSGLKCAVCREQATRGCTHSGQFVCGAHLCDDCNHAH